MDEVRGGAEGGVGMVDIFRPLRDRKAGSVRIATFAGIVIVNRESAMCILVEDEA